MWMAHLVMTLNKALILIIFRIMYRSSELKYRLSRSNLEKNFIKFILDTFLSIRVNCGITVVLAMLTN
jgi:hypothetical protein